VRTASLAAVVLAAKLLAEATNAMIQPQKNVAGRAAQFGLVRQLRRAALKVAVVTTIVNSAALVGVPAPKEIFAASMSVVSQLLTVGPMDIAQECLRLLRQRPLLLRQKHHSPSAHQSSRLLHACRPYYRLVLMQVIQAITYWLMAAACLSWTLSMSMVSRKS